MVYARSRQSSIDGVGISRQTYYRNRKGYLAEGLEGLEDKDRTPHRSPAQMGV